MNPLKGGPVPPGSKSNDSTWDWIHATWYQCMHTSLIPITTHKIKIMTLYTAIICRVKHLSQLLSTGTFWWLKNVWHWQGDVSSIPGGSTVYYYYYYCCYYYCYYTSSCYKAVSTISTISVPPPFLCRSMDGLKEYCEVKTVYSFSILTHNVDIQSQVRVCKIAYTVHTSALYTR